VKDKINKKNKYGKLSSELLASPAIQDHTPHTGVRFLPYNPSYRQAGTQFTFPGGIEG